MKQNENIPSRSALCRTTMDFLLKVLRFTLYGIPALGLAVILNWLLVDKFSCEKSVSYALVLIFQVTVNFFVCYYFVFERNNSSGILSQFVRFMSGILLARSLDWGLYTILVMFTPVHYLIIQLGNTLLFACLKYSFAKRTIEGIAPRTVEQRSSMLP